MAKKSFDKKESKPFDIFSEGNAAQKQEKSSIGNLVTSLRTDMVPASDAHPAKKSIFQRENLKVAVGILLSLVIIGLILYAIAGQGRPTLERNLANLVQKEITPTQTVTPSAIPSTNTPPPQPSNTPSPSPTIRPTNTPVIKIVDLSTPLQSITPTPSSDCRDVLSITLEDVGQTLCVHGIVIETVTYPTNFLVIFSNKKGAFYWVSYDLVWSQAEVDTCYRVHGTIDRIGNSPVLLFNLKNLPEACP